MDDDILQGFKEESLEHLSTVETDLLLLEEQGMNPEVINRLFRSFHTVKGGAGFFQLDDIRHLAHEAEGLLDQLRSSVLTLTPEIVHVLLQACDQLQSLLQNQPLSAAQIEASIHALLECSSHGNDAAVIAPPMASPEDVRFSDDQMPASNPGRHLYHLSFPPSEESKVSAALTGLGDVLARKSTAGLRHVLFSSVLEPDLAGTCLGLEPRQVVHLPSGKYPCAAPPVQPKNGLGQTRSGLGGSGTSALLPGKTRSGLGVSGTSVALPVPASRAAARQDNIRVPVKTLDLLMSLAGELVLARNQLIQAGAEFASLKEINQQIDVVTTKLQESVMRTRMQPVGGVFNKFQRVVRDISQQLGKEVELVISGSEVEIDKSVVESIGDPLTHMIRNSLDHGIESPEQRLSAGKNRQGQIQLRALQESGHIIIVIEDDGRGMDAEKIGAKAVEKGLVKPEKLAHMSSQEILSFIFHPGFSTAESVTAISGRGVGMDVVLSTLKSLNGSVSVSSTLGQGSAIRMQLPLTLSIMPSLLISCGQRPFAIPQANLIRIVRLSPAQKAESCRHVGGRQVVSVGTQLIPLVKLSDTLHLESEPGDDCLMAIVGSDGKHFALQVDQILDAVEIVVKPFGRHLKKLAAYGGVTVLGDGQLAPILSIQGIADLQGLVFDESQVAAKVEESVKMRFSYLLLRAGEEILALPMRRVKRVLRRRRDELRLVAGRPCLEYLGRPLPCLEAADIPLLQPRTDSDQINFVVLSHRVHDIAFAAWEILDNIETESRLDADVHRRPGIAGSFLHNGVIVQVINPDTLTAATHPEWNAALLEAAK